MIEHSTENLDRPKVYWAMFIPESSRCRYTAPEAPCFNGELTLSLFGHTLVLGWHRSAAFAIVDQPTEEE